MIGRLSSIVGAIMCLALLALGCAKPVSPSKFDSIRQMVIDGNFEAAIPRLAAFQSEHPGSTDGSRAGLFLGKAYLGLGELDEAANAFEATIAKYPKSLEAHKSRYKLGFIALLRDDPEKAEAIFDRLADERGGPLAPEAMAMCVYLRRDG